MFLLNIKAHIYYIQLNKNLNTRQTTNGGIIMSGKLLGQ